MRTSASKVDPGGNGTMTRTCRDGNELLSMRGAANQAHGAKTKNTDDEMAKFQHESSHRLRRLRFDDLPQRARSRQASKHLSRMAHKNRFSCANAGFSRLTRPACASHLAERWPCASRDASSAASGDDPAKDSIHLMREMRRTDEGDEENQRAKTKPPNSTPPTACKSFDDDLRQLDRHCR